MTPSNASPISGTPPPSSPARDRTPFDRPASFGRESPAPMDRPSSNSSKASPSAAMPSRSNTMSWQRRPTSTSRSRPLSALASENNAARSPHRAPEPHAEETEEQTQAPSRDRIAESLASKDPAWFRQTADRGRSSPAYRTSRDEGAQDDGDLRRQLPGLARNTAHDATSAVSPPLESPHSASPSRLGSVRGSAAWSSRPSSTLSSLDQRTVESKSPLPSLDSQKFAPPPPERTSTGDSESTVIGRTMSNAQNRISMDRPPSPTKGMGGFVQSAMLKRNDSVSKRWSAQPGASLTRTDSTASIRSGFGSIRDGMAASRSMPRLDTTGGAESQSRPGSSHSTISNLAIAPEYEAKFAKPAIPSHSHSRSKSVASVREGHTVDSIPEGLTSPPLSPSKRWSPTKASWLESALARPESPKPAMQSNQPSWMAEITKAKQQRSSGESTLSQDNLDVAKAQDIANLGPTLLKRSSLRDVANPPASTRIVTPPTKAKPASLVGKSADVKPESREPDIESAMPPPKPKVQTLETTADLSTTSRNKTVLKPLTSKPAALSSPFASPDLESSSSSAFQSALAPKPLSVPASKPKPETPPKKDFRAGLKPRSDVSGGAANQEPEFKSMFGKLKRTQAEKYVAPDELKNNILRGKSGLSLTGGPQKTERRDELKESLLQKKEEMKTTKPERKVSAAPVTDVPEALRIKKQLGRSNSAINVALSDNQRRDITPEALSLHKSLRGKPRALSPEKRSSVTEKPEDKALPVMSNMLHKSMSTPNPSHEILETGLPKVESKVATSNKFAERFNPALAGLLARGPPTTSSNPATPRSASPISYTASSRTNENQSAGTAETGGELTHMTKNRAKGPKRRKPNAKSTASAAVEATPEKRLSSVQSIKSAEVLSSSPKSKVPLQPAPKSAAVRAVSINLSQKQPAEEEQRSISTPTKAATKTPDAPKAPASSDSPPGLKTVSQVKPLSTPRKLPSSVLQTPSSSTKLAATSTPSTAKVQGSYVASTAPPSESTDADKENVSSVKSAASMWGRQTPGTVSQTRNKPIELPTRKDEEAALKGAGLSSPTRNTKPPALGLGISQSSLGDPAKRLDKGEYPASPPSTAGLPPKPIKSSRIVSGTLRDSRDTKGESRMH